MNAQEIRAMTDEQILDEIEDLKVAEFNLRIQKATGQLENTNVMRNTRRDIARLKTILHERRLAAQVAQKEGNKNA